MKEEEKARHFKVWLNPRNKQHAVCIKRLDELREKINEGAARRGDLSAAIAEALCAHFCRDGNNGKGLLLPKPAKSNAPSPLSHQATDADQPDALTETLLMGEQAEPRDLFAKLNRLADSF